MQSKTPKRIMVDFDRVIHRYSKGWKDGSIYDKAVPGAIKAIKDLQKAGFEVVVFTTESERGELRHHAIRTWLKRQGLNLQVTSTKLPCIAIIDDRAIRFEGNWNSIVRYFI